jgi:hypothetical protein
MLHIEISHELLAKIEGDLLTPVLVESPLASTTLEGWVRNKKFARAAARDCLARAEAPYASHLFYAQEGLLDDDIAEERALGIHAGLVWGKLAAKSIVYTDLGISSGMERGIARAKLEGRSIEYRELGFIPEPTAKEIALETLRREVEADLKATATALPNTAKP